jgi:hypothetical protein
MRFFVIIAALASVATVLPASAQFGNPGGLDPATRESAPGVPAPGQTNVPDRLFTTLAAQGGMAEVELGKLAQQKWGYYTLIPGCLLFAIQCHNHNHRNVYSAARIAPRRLKAARSRWQGFRPSCGLFCRGQM